MTNELTNLEKITIAALLHDIGKVLQRSGYNKRSGDNKTTVYSSGEKHEHIGFNYLINEIGFNLEEHAEILLIAANHTKNYVKFNNLNKTHSLITRMSKYSDIISCGHDRRAVDKKPEAKGIQSIAPLISSFNLFNIDDIDKNVYCYDPKTVNNECCNYLLPKETNNIKDYSYDEDYYKAIEKPLTESLRAWQKSDLKNINLLLNILEANTYFVPSDTRHFNYPDISLYDHSKTTAAFASCFQKIVEINKLKRLSMVKKDYFLLLKCDFSGIQNFIYNISKDEALKMLRARSFYIEFLVEYIADTILQKYNLTRANLMSTCGGSFFVLLPNLTSIDDELKELENQINNWLLDNFENNLYVAFSTETATGKTLQTKIWDLDKTKKYIDNRKTSVKQLWLDLSKKINKEKSQKYLSSSNFPALFTPQDITGKRQCKVCKAFVKETTFKENKCELCNAFINFGKELFKGKESLKVQINKEKRIAEVVLDNSSYSLPLPYLYIDQYPEYFIYNGQKIFSNEQLKNVPIRLNTYYDSKDGDSNSFKEHEELAGLSTGTKKLAVLRMDVDNLGKIFTSNEILNDYFAGFTRYHTISRSVNDFFKRYIQAICSGDFYKENTHLKQFKLIENNEIVPRKVNVIYSGGDDLLITGSWSDIVEVAFDIQNVFKEYTCGKLNLSAAITLHSYSHPIHLMAKSSQKALDYAKSKKADGKGHLVLFGEQPAIGIGKPYYLLSNWDEAEKIKNRVESLINAFSVDNDDSSNDTTSVNLSISHNLLRKFYLFIKNYLHKNSNTPQENRLELFPLIYLLGRNTKDLKGKAKNEWDKLEQQLFNADVDEYKELEAVFAWLLLLTRKSNPKGGDNE